MSHLVGEIVVIKRDQSDGARYRWIVEKDKVVFGRHVDVDIRVQMTHVSQEHCQVVLGPNNTVILENLSPANPTLCNGKAFGQSHVLKHKDVFTVIDRCFRFEYANPPIEEPAKNTPKRKSSVMKTPLGNSPRTPQQSEPLRNSITKLRSSSTMVSEEDEDKENVGKSVRRSPRIADQENECQLIAVKTPKSLLKRKSIGHNKRVSFGSKLSPELFDKRLPPSTPLRKGASPVRSPAMKEKRRSEPISKQVLLSVTKKRHSMGIGLSEPVIEEEESPKASENEDLLLDLNTPPPLMSFDDSDGEESDSVQTPTGILGKEVKEAMKQLKNRDLKKRLATPLKKAIQEGTELKQTLPKMKTPVREEILAGVTLKQTKKKLKTPLRKEIQKGATLRATKKKIGTPLKNEILNGVDLKETKKKLATPLRKEIQCGVTLKETKKKLGSPLQKEIKAGRTLRKTKPKLPTPVRDQIQQGVQLKGVYKKLASPVRKQIEKKPELKATKKKVLKTPMKKAIQSRPALRQTLKKGLKTPIRKQIKEGVELKKTLRQLPTTLDITAGICLDKETRKSPRIQLLKETLKVQDNCETPTSTRKKSIRTKTKSTKTPNAKKKPTYADMLKKGIKEKEMLKKLKMKTPLRKQIHRGIKLKKTLKKLPASLQDEIVEGVALKATKKTLPTPLKKDILKGKELKAAKKKLQTPLKKQIKAGTTLRATQKAATPSRRRSCKTPTRGKTPKKTKATYADMLKKGIKEKEMLKKLKMKTPLKKQIHRGVKLKKTLQKLPDALQEEILTGVPLRTTKKSMPTPIKQEILKGRKLKEVKKKLQTPLKKQIQKGTTLKATKSATPARTTRRKSTARTPAKTPAGKKADSKKVQSAKKKKATYADMLKKGIKEKEMLKKLKMKTPLKKQILRGVRLNPTMKKMQTPLRVDIQQGVKLRAAKKKLQTPLKKAIENGVVLKETKRKLKTTEVDDMEKETTNQNGRRILKAKRNLPKLAIPPIDSLLMTFTGEKTEEVSNYPARKRARRCSTPYKKVLPTELEHTPSDDALEGTSDDEASVETQTLKPVPKKKTPRRKSTSRKTPVTFERRKSSRLSVGSVSCPIALDETEDANTTLQNLFTTPAVNKRRSSRRATIIDKSIVIDDEVDESVDCTTQDAVVVNKDNQDANKVDFLMEKVAQDALISTTNSKAIIIETEVDETVGDSMKALFKTPATEAKVSSRKSVVTDETEEDDQSVADSMQTLFKTPATEAKVSSRKSVVTDETDENDKSVAEATELFVPETPETEFDVLQKPQSISEDDRAQILSCLTDEVQETSKKSELVKAASDEVVTEDTLNDDKHKKEHKEIAEEPVVLIDTGDVPLISDISKSCEKEIEELPSYTIKNDEVAMLTSEQEEDQSDVENVSSTEDTTDPPKVLEEANELESVVKVSGEANELEPVSEVLEEANELEQVSEVSKEANELGPVSEVAEEANELEPVAEVSKEANELEQVIEVSEEANELEQVSEVSQEANELEPVAEVQEEANELELVNEINLDAAEDPKVVDKAALAETEEIVPPTRSTRRGRRTRQAIDAPVKSRSSIRKAEASPVETVVETEDTPMEADTQDEESILPSIPEEAPSKKISSAKKASGKKKAAAKKKSTKGKKTKSVKPTAAELQKLELSSIPEEEEVDEQEVDEDTEEIEEELPVTENEDVPFQEEETNEAIVAESTLSTDTSSVQEEISSVPNQKGRSSRQKRPSRSVTKVGEAVSVKRSRRGRKETEEISVDNLEVTPIEEVNNSVELAEDQTANEELNEKDISAPVRKPSRRGRAAKQSSNKSDTDKVINETESVQEDVTEVTDNVCQEADVAPADVEIDSTEESSESTEQNVAPMQDSISLTEGVPPVKRTARGGRKAPASRARTSRRKAATLDVKDPETENSESTGESEDFSSRESEEVAPVKQSTRAVRKGRQARVSKKNANKEKQEPLEQEVQNTVLSVEEAEIPVADNSDKLTSTELDTEITDEQQTVSVKPSGRRGKKAAPARGRSSRRKTEVEEEKTEEVQESAVSSQQTEEVQESSQNIDVSEKTTEAVSVEPEEVVSSKRPVRGGRKASARGRTSRKKVEFSDETEIVISEESKEDEVFEQEKEEANEPENVSEAVSTDEVEVVAESVTAKKSARGSTRASKTRSTRGRNKVKQVEDSTECEVTEETSEVKVPAVEEGKELATVIKDEAPVEKPTRGERKGKKATTSRARVSKRKVEDEDTEVEEPEDSPTDLEDVPQVSEVAQDESNQATVEDKVEVETKDEEEVEEVAVPARSSRAKRKATAKKTIAKSKILEEVEEVPETTTSDNFDDTEKSLYVEEVKKTVVNKRKAPTRRGRNAKVSESVDEVSESEVIPIVEDAEEVAVVEEVQKPTRGKRKAPVKKSKDTVVAVNEQPVVDDVPVATKRSRGSKRGAKNDEAVSDTTEVESNTEEVPAKKRSTRKAAITTEELPTTEVVSRRSKRPAKEMVTTSDEDTSEDSKRPKRSTRRR